MKKYILYPALVFVFFFNTKEGFANFRLTENKGQWAKEVLFKADLNSLKLFVSKGQLTYLFYSAKQIYDAQHNNNFDDSLLTHTIKVNFLNANPQAEYMGERAYKDYSNFFLGNNPKHWAGGVLSYQKLTIKNIYPNIDFELLEDKGFLKYNFIVHPNGDPNQIQLEYVGANNLEIKNQELIYQTVFGAVTEKQPLVFEQTKTADKIIASQYVLENNVLKFNVSAKRNKRNTLIIDPVLVFSTFSGSRADNFGYTATYDSLGNGYAGGTVFDVGFPTTTGAFQISFKGGNNEDRAIGYVARDCGITKYSKDGSSLLYSTYLGGGLSNDQPHSMVVNSKNQLLVMGSTKSFDFPLGIGVPYSNSVMGLSDIFVVKFSEDGKQLLSGTFVGGSSYDGLNGDRPSKTITPLMYNYADDFRGEIIVDKQDNVFVVTSTNSSDFPMVLAFDNTYGGKQDGVIFKLNADLSDLLFSSYIGGAENDAAYGLDFGTNNDLFITGGTNTQTFDYTNSGNKLRNSGGKADGYLLRLNLANWAVLANTFIGTSAYDQTHFVKVDKYGKPFVFGQTEGNMSASSGVYSIANGKMFIKKYSADLSSIELETTFGATNKNLPDLSPTAFLVDECERIFVSGWGGFNLGGFRGGSTNNMPITSDAFQKTTDGHDFYLAVFSKNLSALQYATYMGGKSTTNDQAHEHVDGGTCRFDKKGIVYHSVCAGCGAQSLFPTTPGAWSRTNNSDNCNNALFKFDFENLNRKPQIKDSIYYVMASDTLEFFVEISDPDLGDDLDIQFFGLPFSNPNFPNPPVIKETIKDANSNKITKKIQFIASCKHIDLDTIYIYVKVYDRGCPSSDSNFAVIKIIVTDPPQTTSPDVICLAPVTDRSINLTWKSFEKNRFFKYVILYRENPNGSIKTLDTIRNSNASNFLDILPSDPSQTNYTYYMISYNICNKPFDANYRISTQNELNVAIDSTYLVYATVEDNKNIHINWLKTKEDDFGSYDIYRKETNVGKTSNYRKIAVITDINDTNFIDHDVIVNERVYCYKTIVNDKCGHRSNFSNEACNIVLRGNTGKLYFDLNWTDYRKWQGEVKSYELQRRVDTGTMREITNTGLLRTHHDEDLDIWWGAYYYVVKAYEDTFNQSGFNAISFSNALRLVQPPLVFVPNAFSPNSDAHNDVWGISHAFVKEYNLKVFNRWGEKVWENENKGNQWDGVSKGKSSNNDVYVWIVTYKGWDGKFYTQKGTVTVMP